MDEKLKIFCAAAFGAGPFHVERRTNSLAEICNNSGRAVAQCSWSVDAAERAEVLCALLNLALGHGPNAQAEPTAPACRCESAQAMSYAAPRAHNQGKMMTTKYRKKPVVIEAFQMTRERRMDNRDWPDWLNAAWNKTEGEPGAVFRQNMDAPMPDLLRIWTLEGVHLVDWDDWIIRGVKGELYPCKPDIFAATYEPA